jgi:hypothetical protein
MVQTDLVQALREVEKYRVNSLLFCLIPFGALLGFSFLLRYIIQFFAKPGIVGIVAIFLFPLFLAFILSASVVQPYKDKFRKDLIPKLISGFYPKIVFLPDKHLKTIDICKSSVFIADAFEGFTGEGLLEINSDGYNARAELIHASISNRWYRSSGKQGLTKHQGNPHSGFSGFFSIIDLAESNPDFSGKEVSFVVIPCGSSLSKDISAVALTMNFDPDPEKESWTQEVSVSEKETPQSGALKYLQRNSILKKAHSLLEKKELTEKLQLIWQASEQVPVEDSEFNSHFVAYAKTPGAIRLIQNSIFRHKFIEIRDKWKFPMYFSVQGTKCYVAFSRKDDLFCPSIWAPLNEKTETQLKNDIEELLSLIRSAVSIANAVVL